MILSMRLEDADLIQESGGQGHEGIGVVVRSDGVDAEVLDGEPMEGQAAPPAIDGWLRIRASG